MIYVQESRVFGEPISFLPENVDLSECVEISQVGDRYAKYLNTKTGYIVDCETYYKKHMENLE